MGRIEEIKRNCEITSEHIKKMDDGKLGFHIMSYQRDYVNDVSFLLSRIQIAEEALNQILDVDGRNQALCVHDIVRKALEQIQKEE